jgi:hypothetical protein
MLVFLAHQSVWAILNFNSFYSVSGALIESLLSIKRRRSESHSRLSGFFGNFCATSAIMDSSRWALNHDYWGGHLIVDLSLSRLVPSSVKQAVFILDGGECVECGSSYNLHFCQIPAYSKGGTSYSAENVQIPSARLNLSKSTKMI